MTETRDRIIGILAEALEDHLAYRSGGDRTEPYGGYRTDLGHWIVEAADDALVLVINGDVYELRPVQQRGPRVEGA